LLAVEDDVRKFSDLPPYKKMRLTDIDMKEKSAGAQIT